MNEIISLDYYSPTVHPKIHILIAIQKHNVAKPWKPFEGSKLLQGTPYRFHIRQHSFCAKRVTQVITVAWQWVTKQLRSLEFHIEEPKIIMEGLCKLQNDKYLPHCSTRNSMTYVVLQARYIKF